jgi:hypothetical protein
MIIGKGASAFLVGPKKTSKSFVGFLPDRNVAVTTETWYKLVDMISQKSFSIAKDHLPAMGSIAERFALLSEDEYLAGIW